MGVWSIAKPVTHDKPAFGFNRPEQTGERERGAPDRPPTFPLRTGPESRCIVTTYGRVSGEMEKN